MAAESEPGARVIDDYAFAFARRRERWNCFHDRCGRKQRRGRLDARDLPVRHAPVPGKRGKRVRAGKQFQIACIELRAPCQIVDRIETALRAHGGQPRGRLFGETDDPAETQTHRRFVIHAVFERAFPCAYRDVHRPHLDAVAARVLHELRRPVKTHWLAVEECGEKCRRLMAFQPCRDISKQRETDRVRFGKTVFAEAEYLAIDLFRELALVAVREHSGNEALLQVLQPAFALPCRHRAPQQVGFARRKTGGDHRELHDLFLEYRHAERALEHAPYGFARVTFFLEPLLAAQIGMHHAALDRAGTHDRDLNHEVVEFIRPQARQHAHLRARLDLEHADRIGAPDHGINLGIFGRNSGHFELRAAPRADHVESAADGGQHAKSQHVDFQQTERFEIALVPLDHAAVRHRGVFDRHQPRQWPARNHETADVLRQMARETDECVDEENQACDLRTRGIEPGFREPLRQRFPVVPPRQRFGEPVELRGIEAECFADVTQRALRAIADDGGGEGSAVAAVFFIDVLDHLFAALVLEIDVDIGRLVAFPRNETLEQYAHARGIDRGDAQCVAHRRVGGGAAALAQDIFAAREPDDVVDGEKKWLVCQFRYQCEFVLYEFAYLVGSPAGKTLAQPFFGQQAQVRSRRVAGGHQFLRIFVAQTGEREVAALGDAHALSQELSGINLRQPHAQAQMTFGVGIQRVSGVGDGGVKAHRGQQVLQGAARTHVHVHVACRDQRQTAGKAEFAQAVEPGAVVGPAQELRR